LLKIFVDIFIFDESKVAGKWVDDVLVEAE